MVNKIFDQLSELSHALYDKVVAHRRHLHENPELSFYEYETSAYIKNQLQKLGITYHEVAVTGVIGVIEGKKIAYGKTVVLRADIDALPILEESGVDFSSKNEGVMHACGHDFHTANLLGVAEILKQQEDTFGGKVLLLFQPAEEKIPGGAKAVIESGYLEKLGDDISAVLGLHVTPKLNAGQIGICAGRFMASSDEIYLKIKGRGGHAAEPHNAIDPIMVAVQTLSNLQQVVSRKADPSMPSVLTFGKIIGNGAANVIPDEVWLEGTFRTMDELWRKQAHQHIEDIITNTAAMFGAETELEIRQGYPVLMNDIRLSQYFKEIVIEHLGEDLFENISEWMAGEDFAYYSHKYPSLFFLVGIKNADRKQYGLHNAKFDLEEQAFLSAMQTMAFGCLKFLEEIDE